MLIQAESESEAFRLLVHVMTVPMDDTDDDQGPCLQTAVMRVFVKASVISDDIFFRTVSPRPFGHGKLEKCPRQPSVCFSPSNTVSPAMIEIIFWLSKSCGRRLLSSGKSTMTNAALDDVPGEHCPTVEMPQPNTSEAWCE